MTAGAAQLETIGNLKLTLRCDAGETIGMGHVKRCLGLATWLSVNPAFALFDTPKNVHAEIQDAGYETIDLRGTNQEQAQQLKRLVHYIPLHKQQPYYRRRYGDISLPNAEIYYERCLSIPMFPTMSDGDVERVAPALSQVVGGAPS